MTRMTRVRVLSVLTLAGAVVLGGSTFAGDEMTLTGTVGDAMCRVEHAMPDAKACTLGCFQKGSLYALIVDDTAYTLETSSDALKMALAELAGSMAAITGDVTGTTIAVTAIETTE